MSFVGLTIPGLPVAGLEPLRVARNDMAVSAAHAGQMAAYLNALAGRRFKLHFSKSIHYQDAYNSNTSKNIWLFQGHTSPNCRVIRVSMVFAPKDNALAAGNPSGTWTTDIGGTTNAQTAISVPNIADTVFAPGVAHPYEYTVAEQDWTDLDGLGNIRNQTFKAVLNVTGGARPITCSVYEIPFTSASATDLKSGTSLGIAPIPGTGSPIYDRHVTDYVGTMETIWKRQSPPIFAWSVHNGTYLSVTGTTFTNPLDSTTSWGAATRGFWWRNKDRGTRNSNNIPATFWCYGRGVSTDGECKFVDSSGTIATITLTAGLDGWFSTTGNLDASTADKIDFQIRNTSAGNDCRIYAAGIYQYEA